MYAVGDSGRWDYTAEQVESSSAKYGEELGRANMPGQGKHTNDLQYDYRPSSICPVANTRTDLN
jgi:hypothetical protein